jgi:glyoxylase I family protein
MEKGTGIGGFFFRAQDLKALGRWYQQQLGVSLTPSSY